MWSIIETRQGSIYLIAGTDLYVDLYKYRPTTGEATWRSKRKEGLDHPTGSIAVETLKTHALLFVVMLKNYSRVPRDDDDGSRSAPIDPVGPMELIETLLLYTTTYLYTVYFLRINGYCVASGVISQDRRISPARLFIDSKECRPTWPWAYGIPEVCATVVYWEDRLIHCHSLSVRRQLPIPLDLFTGFPSSYVYTYLPDTYLVGNCSICIYLTSADSIPFFHSTDY
jgi:hypothetical protein